ncbi:hypothetical protein TTHERM_01014540 (macronuclear) [Tetrahymena thermophila SB210]|uniref:Uncharacterized protein n=1 Tax=Tetrahymena thermophila (strain SB210) TaxID=312017 RepID=Q22CY2_TETTS|nr:hypothetical protein TTHERM_01014540 [Tetrahymena thermophila SB210]EAR83137.2 hypothetical protein TTHERM_01014540 [Tetrahymena thermophila SB210]|eukprot:XP_001030800.2 hypothetical protein TTHERM_01014540 [Tetrahymena thermophila SB210]
MKTQSTSSTLPQSNKDSFSPMFKQIPVPQQSVLKQKSDSQYGNRNKQSIRGNLHYRMNFQENSMQYTYFKVYFKDSMKKKYAIDIENDYDYPQTCDFVERVVRQLNEQYDLNLPFCASNYCLYFAKKNGSRNSSYPEIDMYNTNIQTALKYHDKNLFRLKFKISDSQKNSFMKESSIMISQAENQDLNLSDSKMIYSQNGKNLDRSVLTNITNNAQQNEKAENKLNQKYNIKEQKFQESNQTGLFGCFRLC